VCQCMQIMDMIQGVQPLPWEDPDTAPVLMRNFGYFKNAVMSLLERDPARRPSMAEFRRKCNRVLLQTTRS
jgi:hypothetical protein